MLALSKSADSVKALRSVTCAALSGRAYLINVGVLVRIPEPSVYKSSVVLFSKESEEVGFVTDVTMRGFFSRLVHCRAQATDGRRFPENKLRGPGFLALQHFALAGKLSEKKHSGATKQERSHVKIISGEILSDKFIQVPTGISSGSPQRTGDGPVHWHATSAFMKPPACPRLPIYHMRSRLTDSS